MMLVFLFIIFSELFLSKATVNAPFVIGPKIKSTYKHDESLEFLSLNGSKPFYLPDLKYETFTETVTETIQLTETTTKLINIGTTSTRTSRLTVTSTTTLTTTELEVSVAQATTTVALTKTVFGGLITTTRLIDTTIVSTLFITPIAASSESFVTRISRTTLTISVTATTVSRTIQTLTAIFVTTFPAVDVVVNFASTSTLVILTNDPAFETVTTTLFAYTATSTPPNYNPVTFRSTSEFGISSLIFATLFISDGPETTLSGDYEATITATREPTLATETITTSALISFTQFSFITTLIT